MIPVLTDLRNAYEAHDREAFDRHLKRVEEMLRYTGPTPEKRGECALKSCHCAKFGTSGKPALGCEFCA